MIPNGCIRLGMTVYKSIRDKKICKQAGTIIEILPYQYCRKKFKVRWENGKEEVLLSKDLRISKPGEKQKRINYTGWKYVHPTHIKKAL